MSGITGLQNLYVMARDMDRMAAFYNAALGGVVKFRDGTNWTQLKVGTANFALASEEEAGAGRLGATPVFNTEDIAASTRAIEAAGGKLLGTRDMGDHGKTATFSDPEGNVFQVLQRHS